MTTVRGYHDKNHPYIMTSKADAWDLKDDLDALGLWLLILSRPDDWKVKIKELAQTCSCDKKKIYRLINILIDKGFACRHQPRDANNIFLPIEYIIFENKKTPDEIKEMFPQSGFWVSGFRERGTYSTNRTLNDINNNDDKDVHNSNVHNCKPEHPKSSIAASSSLSSMEDKREAESGTGAEKAMENESREFLELKLAFLMEGFKISDAALKRWLRKYEYQLINMTANLMRNSERKQLIKDKFIERPEAWMERALKDGFVERPRNYI